MKALLISLVGLSMLTVFSSASGTRSVEDIQFVCLKTHKASNSCHFNFKVDGAKYRYVDQGCRYSKKTDDLIKKVQAGELFLAKDWKIECPEPKQ